MDTPTTKDAPTTKRHKKPYVSRTLIVWFDGNTVSLYAVPIKELKKYDPEGFATAHGKMLNSRQDDEGTDDWNRIEYLAWLLGEEPHFGPIPTLADWLALKRPHNAVALSHDKELSKRGQEPEAEAPFKQYKLEGTDMDNCHRVISTGWYM